MPISANMSFCRPLRIGPSTSQNRSSNADTMIVNTRSSSAPITGCQFKNTIAHHRAEFHGLTDSERCSRIGRLEVGQPFDVVHDVMLLQVCDLNAQKEREQQQSSRGVEPRCILRLHESLPCQRPSVRGSRPCDHSTALSDCVLFAQ